MTRSHAFDSPVLRLNADIPVGEIFTMDGYPQNCMHLVIPSVKVLGLVLGKFRSLDAAVHSWTADLVHYMCIEFYQTGMARQMNGSDNQAPHVPLLPLYLLIKHYVMLRISCIIRTYFR